MTGIKEIRTRLAAPLIWFGALLRWKYLLFTLCLPLIGAASVAGDSWQSTPTVVLLAVAVTFHVFGVVINDLVDLPLDRTHPGRCKDPLPSGSIKPWQGLALALSMIPVAVSLSAWRGADWRSYSALAAAAAGLTVYNLWGKRFRFPPLTDFAQGLGFGSLALYGAFMTGEAGWTSLFVCLAVAVWTLAATLTGGLRDVYVDRRYGAVTTPIWLGVVPAGPRIRIPSSLGSYCLAVTCLFLGIVSGVLSLDDLGYATTTRVALTVAVALLAIVAIRRPARVLRATDVDHAAVMHSVRLNLAATALALLVVLAPRYSPGLLITVGLVYLTSLLIFRSTTIAQHS